MTKARLIRLKQQVDKISKQLDKILKEDYPVTKVAPRSVAPDGYSWYDYLQKRLASSDLLLSEWHSLQESSDFGLPDPVTRKYYFKLWLTKTKKLSFIDWVRKTHPEWTGENEAE